MPLAVLIIVSYIAGSIPFGLFIGKTFFKKDLREYGSHNTGATNAWRELGPAAGTVIFVLDLAKGLLPILAARHYYPTLPLAIVGAGFAAIIGHTVSPFLRFKGGKGVATSLGVAFGLSWKGGLVAFASWGAILAVTQYVSVASIIATAIGATMITVWNGDNVYFGVFGAFAAIYVFVKHISNIKRLMQGEERKVPMPWSKQDPTPSATDAASESASETAERPGDAK